MSQQPSSMPDSPNDAPRPLDLETVVRQSYPQYHPRAFVFVLEALESTMRTIGQRRHLTGAELADGIKNAAFRQFGCMARLVLESWGLTCTRDFGEIVFGLVAMGVMSARPEDRVEDFDDRWPFSTLDAEYRIGVTAA